MSDISGHTYRDLLIPHFLEVLKIMDEVLTSYQVPYYLIGVNATNLQFLKEGIKPFRGTKDIDFAVMLSSFAEYEKIKDALTYKGFHKLTSPFTLIHGDYSVVIDLLPFGQIEENDTVSFTEREVIMNVLGFKETLEEAKEISVDHTFSILVPPLHGMVVLKLISWSDRPEVRANDLEDIYRIVSHYCDIESKSLYSEHADLLDTDTFDNKRIAARLMGRRIAFVLEKSNKVKARILNVLSVNATDPMTSEIGKYWAGRYDISVEYAITILELLRLGIQDNLAKNK